MKLPDERGSYGLLLHLATDKSISIGRLGTFLFPAGTYLYLGSAFGPGGLAARLNRHIAGAIRLHWHIDYLRQQAVPEEVWYTVGQRREHAWAAIIRDLPGISTPAPRFGASDCRCSSHLFHFLTPLSSDQLIMSMRSPFISDVIVKFKID